MSADNEDQGAELDPAARIEAAREAHRARVTPGGLDKFASTSIDNIRREIQENR